MSVDFTNRKVLIAIAVVVAIVVLIGIMAINRGVAQGSRAVEKAFAELVSQETLHTNANLVINLPPRLRGRNRPLTRVDITIDGDVTRTSDGTPEVAGTLDAEARGTGNSFFVKGDARIFADEMAFNLSEFPTLLNPSGSLSNKWTYVEVPLLATNNADELAAAVEAMAASATYQDRVDVDGTSTQHYTISLTEEDEDTLTELLTQANSGNRALHTVARLLRANRLDSFDLYINSSNRELTQAVMHFVRPLSDGSTFDFATLTLSFTDYGKQVAVDRPEKQTTVRPDVFSRLFGTGEISTISQ